MRKGHDIAKLLKGIFIHVVVYLKGILYVDPRNDAVYTKLGELFYFSNICSFIDITFIIEHSLTSWTSNVGCRSALFSPSLWWICCLCGEW